MTWWQAIIFIWLTSNALLFGLAYIYSAFVADEMDAEWEHEFALAFPHYASRQLNQELQRGNRDE